MVLCVWLVKLLQSSLYALHVPLSRLYYVHVWYMYMTTCTYKNALMTAHNRALSSNAHDHTACMRLTVLLAQHACTV